jgi:competence protein ComEC
MSLNESHFCRNFIARLSFFILIILGGLIPSIAQASLRVHFINVGYGDAIFIEFPDFSNMLIDAGHDVNIGDPAEADEVNATELVPYLKSLNIIKIDRALITHPHDNHFEGFFNVYKNWPIRRVFINGDDRAEEGYFKLLEKFKQNKIPIEILRRGQSINDLPAEVEIQILHPYNLLDSPNASSIVCRLIFNEISILFMGDIEPKIQDELIFHYEKIGDADCIKVPHHGGPVSDLFAKTFADKIFIISTGKNSWGIPLEQDLNKLKGKIFRTDEMETIILESDGFKIEVRGING